MWGYSGFDTTAPYDLFDFRVSRHRDGPAEYLEGYTGHVMADHPEAVRTYREQERRDKADNATVHAAKRRMRSQLRKSKYGTERHDATLPARKSQ